MSPDLRSTLEAWLTSEDAALRSHAHARLSMPDEAAVQPEPEPPRPTAAEALAALRSIAACPDRDPRTDCGCGGLATCRRGRGHGGLVNQQDCLSCLRETSAHD